MFFDPIYNGYFVTDLKTQPIPVNDMDQLEEFSPFDGYSDVDGCIWQFNYGPKVVKPAAVSNFVSDREGDSWYMCHHSFLRFMLCQEKSPVKIDEAHLVNGGFFSYPCYDQLDSLFDDCGFDIITAMFEAYRSRVMSGSYKAPNFARNQTFNEPYGGKDRKVLHY